ncbi:MAG: PH domain-containing protein [Candidatus Berkelbacteria bacterium]
MNNSDFTFKGQRPDEKVFNVVRRHPIVFFWSLLQSTLALAVAIIVLIYFDFGDMFYIIGGLAALFIFAVVSKVWFIYANSFCLITSQRVINVDQRGFFNRQITETEFSKIQDVTNSTSGMIGTTLNVGQIEIQTAGKENKLTIKHIPDPYQVQQEITKNI